MAVDPDVFERMFAADADPWRFRTRWYEARKRELTLASLPAQRYRSAYEPGCANGELSAALAPRCDRLLVSDGAAAAVALARQRLAGYPQVRVSQAMLPDEWPDATFDLIVVSEIGYYLTSSALATLAVRARASLRDGGTIVACHWRSAIEGCEQTGDGVHELLQSTLELARIVEHVERDFRIDVWSTDARPVSERDAMP